MADPAELTDFLMEHFSPAELTHLLTRLRPHRDILKFVASGSATPVADFHHQATEALVRRGLVDEALFTAMSQVRPTFVRQVRALAASFGIAIELPAPQTVPPHVKGGAGIDGSARTEDARLRRMVLVQKGHHGDVSLIPGDAKSPPRIVKRFDRLLVSREAQQRLATHSSPSLLNPLRYWEQGEWYWQEFAVLDGVKLSRAARTGASRVGGWLLDRFCWQMHSLLQELSKMGVVHRDVHPDNIFVRCTRIGADSVENEAADRRSIFFGEPEYTEWTRAMYPASFRPFLAHWRLDFVLLDCDFAVTEAEQAEFDPVVHGDFTAPETLVRQTTCLSDVFSLGATIYAITHGEPPHRR